jgi:hypothetical protein
MCVICSRMKKLLSDTMFKFDATSSALTKFNKRPAPTFCQKNIVTDMVDPPLKSPTPTPMLVVNIGGPHASI